MAKGKVNVSTWIVPAANAAARISFTLYFKVEVVPEFPFDISVSDMTSPECCFVYSKTTTGPQYGGVCKIADFLQYDNDTAKNKYRSNTYSKEYDDYNTALADQKDISNQLTTFYNNLNTYIESYADQSQSKKIFVLPDYTENRLNDLIGTWRTLKYRIAERKTELSMKEDVWLPSLSNLKLLVAQLMTSADKIVGIDAIKVQDFEKFNSVKETWTALVDKVASLEVEYEVDAARDADVESRLKEIGTRVQSMVNQANLVASGGQASVGLNPIANPIVGAIYHPTTPMTISLTDEQDAVLDSVREALICMKKSKNVSWNEYIGLKTSLETIVPVLDRLKVIAQSDFSEAQTIQAMKDAILSLSKQIDKNISETTKEIEDLKAGIENDKSSMQVVEAQMKQIRPSIDLSNPESAWYFTVNLK